MQYCLDNGRGWPAGRGNETFFIISAVSQRHDCPLSRAGIGNLIFKCKQIKHECWHAVYKWKTGHRFLLAFVHFYLLGCGDLHVWELCGGWVMNEFVKVEAFMDIHGFQIQRPCCAAQFVLKMLLKVRTLGLTSSRSPNTIRVNKIYNKAPQRKHSSWSLITFHSKKTFRTNFS